MPHTIVVNALWDDEARVWFATSDDIDGLALEADTMEDLVARVPGALCDLIELNGLAVASDAPEIPFHVMAQSVGRIPNPCS